MKKTKLTRSLLAACSIVALSVVLSGCLHDSDDGDGMDTGGMMPTVDGNLTLADVEDGIPIEPGTYTVDADLAAAFADAADLAGVDHAMGAMVMVGDVDLTCATGPCRVTVNDNGTITVTGTIHTAGYMPPPDLDGDGITDADDPDRDGDGVANADDLFPDDGTESADADGDGVGDNADTDDDNDGVADADDAFPNDPDESADSDGDGVGDNEEARIAAAIAATTKAAETKETAIAAEAAQGATGSPTAELHADAGLGGTNTTDGTAVTTYTLAISRDRDGTKIEVTDSAQMGDDDPKFAMNDDGMLVRTQEANDDGEVMTEVVLVRTDIEAPKGVAFAMWEAMDGTTPHTLTVRQDGETVVAETSPADSISVEAGTDNVNLPLIMAASFAPPPAGSSSVTHTFLPAADDGDPDTPGDQPRDAAMVDGTYRGADGTYTCGGAADCTVAVDDDGDITAITGTWLFTPDAGATSDQPDYDYLHYGFWLKRTTDSDGVVEYNEVETFAGSSVAASGDVSAVTGTATYEGGAVGVYVHSVINPDGTRASATSGHFTADAVLNAAFGGNDVAVNDQFMISGTIDNFDLSGHDEGPGWSVTLEDGGETDNIDAGAFSGVAKGGGADGSYSGTFHGTADADNQPHTVVGEFNANFSNGTVAGAFGARQDD